MADDADSKSVVGNHVWVQVPLPALKKSLIFEGFFCAITFIFGSDLCRGTRQGRGEAV